jgi:thiol:disulfide interchange protein DsbD
MMFVFSSRRSLFLFSLSSLLFITCITAPIALAGTTPPSHSRVELIAEQDSTSPNHSLSVGVLFHLDPGWHVYWQNAGDSGEPPKIQWTLPPGFRARSPQWPTPTRLGTGTIIDYGYENQFLLIVPIETPKTSQPSHEQPVQLAAAVKYLVCHDICVPAKASLALSLPLPASASGQSSEWPALFRQARAQLPQPAPKTWNISAQSSQDHFVLFVHNSTSAKSATFFPLESSVIENSAPQTFAATKDGLQLTLKKSDQLVKQPATLKGVLVLDGNRSYEIAAHIASK